MFCNILSMFLTITTPQGVAGCPLLGRVRQPTCAVTPWRKIGIQGQPKIPAKGSFGNKFTWQIWSRNLKQPFWFSCFNLGREQKFESFSFLAQTGSWPCATRREPKIDRKLGQMLVRTNKQSSSDHLPLDWCSHNSQIVCPSGLLGILLGKGSTLEFSRYEISWLAVSVCLLNNSTTTSTTLSLLLTGKLRTKVT